MRHTTTLCSTVLLFFFLFKNPLISQCSNPDYAPLASIYNQYNGASWRYQPWDISDCNICEYQGVTCNEDSRVVGIALYAQTTFTELPIEFSQLEFLEQLILDRNDIETVPSEVFSNFQNLNFLSLSGNLLTAFPDSIELLTNLKYLDLAFNDFNEPIPVAFGELENLETLNLRLSNVTSAVPNSLANLSSLKKLFLRDNLLSSFPEVITQIPSLEWIDLSHNDLNDYISPNIGNLVNLVELNLSHTNVIGKIPSEIGNLINLEKLYLDNSSLWGNIPVEIGNMLSLKRLDLSHNDLSGNIPIELFTPTLSSIDLSHNLLSGSIPLEINTNKNMYSLELQNNNLTGNIPETIGDITKVCTINFSYNYLSGIIPPSIGNINEGAIETIDFSHNQLTGPIPPEVGTLFFDGNDDAYLKLSYNQLTGSLPIELFSPYIISNLDVFVDHNQLSGCYDINLKYLEDNPCWYTNAMISDGNNFDEDWEDFCENGSGSCEQLPCAVADYAWLLSINEDLGGENWTNTWDLNDCDICSWYGITCDENNRVIEIDLANNNLSGELPSNIHQLVELQNLYLQHNNITGALIPAIAKFRHLENLYLQHNALTSLEEFLGYYLINELRLNDNAIQGNLPSRLNVAEVLTLQNNMITGPLFEHIAPRKVFNISNNQLSGTINHVNIGAYLPLDSFDISYNNLEGCFNGDLNIELCNIPYRNINEGNLFDVDFDDFCTCQAGICQTEKANYWVVIEGSWDNPSNWSLLHVPLKNESVFVRAPTNPFYAGVDIIVEFPENYESIIYTLELEEGVQLNIPDNSVLNILTEVGWEDLQNCDN